jgi:hypothetical protein
MIPLQQQHGNPPAVCASRRLMEWNCIEQSAVLCADVNFMHSFVHYLFADLVTRPAVFSDRFVDPLSAATRPLSRPRSLH